MIARSVDVQNYGNSNHFIDLVEEVQDDIASNLIDLTENNNNNE